MPRYDEAEICAMRWMIEEKMTTLDFGKKENRDIRGQLMDELEDQFDFFLERTVRRAWRDYAIRGFITRVRNEFQQHPDLGDPSTSRKHQRIDRIGNSNGSQKKYPRVTAKKTLLAYCKIVVQHHRGSPGKHVLYLRDLVDGRSLDDDMNLNVTYVYPILSLSLSSHKY